MTGQLGLLLDPTSGNYAVRRSYLQSLVASFKPHSLARAQLNPLPSSLAITPGFRSPLEFPVFPQRLVPE